MPYIPPFSITRQFLAISRYVATTYADMQCVPHIISTTFYTLPIGVRLCEKVLSQNFFQNKCTLLLCVRNRTEPVPVVLRWAIWAARCRQMRMGVVEMLAVCQVGCRPTPPATPRPSGPPPHPSCLDHHDDSAIRACHQSDCATDVTRRHGDGASK